MHDSPNFRETKRLLENSSLYYIICVDNAGLYSYINPHYARTFEHVDADFVGKPYHITMHPDDVDAVRTAGSRCYAEPGKLFPCTIRKHDGKDGYVITQWEFRLMAENGIAEGVFCIGYDITDYEEVKEKVTYISTDLSQKNDVLRTIAFEQSHLVRAPLANIMGLAAILTTMDLGEEANSLLGALDESCAKLDSVIASTVGKTG